MLERGPRRGRYAGTRALRAGRPGVGLGAKPRTRVAAAFGAVLGALVLAPASAHALDLPDLYGHPLKLDITETSIVAAHADLPGFKDKYELSGNGAWLNRLNLVLGWNHFTLGTRLDSSLYVDRPIDRTSNPSYTLQVDNASRYRNAIYPAKLWLAYKNGGVEVTAGDSYIQFGRGLTLSLRKVDELGLDTTLMGGKVTFQKDPFGFTIFAGLANPARVDEPTGRALFVQRAVPAVGQSSAIPEQPLFGSDRLVGAEFLAGRGSPVILSTHAVRLTKCAPYRYDASGAIVNDTFDKPIGTCEERDRNLWLATLPGSISPVAAARETTNAGQSIEVPSLAGHGNLYVEGAIQQRDPSHINSKNTDGNALYASLVNTGGPISNTIEMKSYRNYWALDGSVNITRASAFSNVVYSVSPTIEPIIADSMFGNFNVCVNGARDRFDYRFSEKWLGYAAFEYAVSKAEIIGGACDRWGHSTGGPAVDTTTHVTDGTLGIEARFDDDKSTLFANLNARDDVLAAGTAYYRELAGQYSLTKYITGPYSVELAGRHRLRIQDGENIRHPEVQADFRGKPWVQGEHYTNLKIAPKWVISQGVEYTSQIGFPTWYFNGAVLYKFTSDSNIRIYAGQNRGGLRCVSGICREFPAFSGARAELTLRF